MTDVLVVGAGPTGLALACLLRRRGIEVRVVDRLRAPAPLAKAMVLWSRSLEVLDELAVADAAVAEGVNLERARYLDGERERAAVRTDRVPGTRWQPTILPQSRLERLLRERLETLGVRVEWGREVTDVVAGSAGVDVAMLTDAGTVEHAAAAYVVGCDGLHSRVREAAGIAWEARARYEEVFQLGDVEATTPLDPTTVHHFLGRQGVSVAIPMPGDRWRVVGYLDGEDPSGAPDAAALQGLLEACGHDATTVGVVHWSGSFRVLRRLAGSFRSGRLLLAGDAAHVHSPAGGQGLNTGVQDAHNLAWKLALVVAGSAGDALLDTYTAERRPVAARILALTQLQDQRLFGARSALARFARNRVLRVADRSGLLERRLIPDLAQVLIDYKRSPLSVGGAPHGSDHRPGRRVTDAEVALEGATTTSLRELAAAGLALLAIPGRNPGSACDELEALAARYGDALALHHAAAPPTDAARPPRRGYVLGLRPDGHIGYRGPYAVTPALRRWLESSLALATAEIESRAPVPA